VSRPTISRIVKKYSEWDMLKTRNVGNATYYSINEESPLVKGIVHFNNLIIEKMLGDEVLYEIHEELQIQTNHSPLMQERVPESTCDSQKPLIKWPEKTGEPHANNTSPIILGQERDGGMIWLGTKDKTPCEQMVTAG